MTFDEFQTAQATDLNGPLLAMWWDARGDWQQAHTVAQDVEDASGAWVHAYLHRKEGDQGNAAYWYRRAGRTAGSGPLSTEWREIVDALLSGM